MDLNDVMERLDEIDAEFTESHIGVGISLVRQLREDIAAEPVHRYPVSATSLVGPAPEFCNQDNWNRLIVEKGHFIAVVQQALETQKSNAKTWQDAILDRIRAIKAGE